MSQVFNVTIDNSLIMYSSSYKYKIPSLGVHVWIIESNPSNHSKELNIVNNKTDDYQVSSDIEIYYSDEIWYNN